MTYTYWELTHTGDSSYDKRYSESPTLVQGHPSNITGQVYVSNNGDRVTITAYGAASQWTDAYFGPRLFKLMTSSGTAEMTVDADGTRGIRTNHHGAKCEGVSTTTIVANYHIEACAFVKLVATTPTTATFVAGFSGVVSGTQNLNIGLTIPFVTFYTTAATGDSIKYEWDTTITVSLHQGTFTFPDTP